MLINTIFSADTIRIDNRATIPQVAPKRVDYSQHNQHRRILDLVPETRTAMGNQGTIRQTQQPHLGGETTRKKATSFNVRRAQMPSMTRSTRATRRQHTNANTALAQNCHRAKRPVHLAIKLKMALIKRSTIASHSTCSCTRRSKV